MNEYQILTYVLPRDKKSAILDFGCGIDFPIVKHLSVLGYRNIVKYDPSMSPTRPLDYLRLWGKEFDIIICRHVAYYFKKEELRKYLSHFNRILNPKGLLLMEVINGASFTAQWPYRNDLDTKIIFTEYSLKKSLHEVGFTHIKIHGDDFKVTSVRSFLWAIVRRFWWKVLSLIYILERGVDSRNPTIFSKNLIIEASCD